VEDKIRRMAVIPGIGMPRAMGASAAPPEASPVGNAVFPRSDAMLASLKAAEGENARLAAERDDLRRQLEAAVAAAAAVAAVNVSPAASPAATPSGSPADMNSLQAAASAPAPGAARSVSTSSSSASPHQLHKLRAEKTEVEAAAAQLRAENEQLRAAASAAVARGSAVNDAEMKLALAQQEAERLRCAESTGAACTLHGGSTVWKLVPMAAWRPSQHCQGHGRRAMLQQKAEA
jgi:regulator of replication initiation timing